MVVVILTLKSNIMVRIFFVLSVLFFTFLKSCVPPFDVAYSFYLENNTNEILGFVVSEKYPDTLIYNNYENLCGLKENSTTPYDVEVELEEYFDSLPADTLSIFFFSMDTISYYGWETVKKDYKILKRCDISYEDLQSQDWTISYP